MADDLEESMKTCLQVLDSLDGGARVEIEAYLVSGFIVSIISQYEKLIEDLVYQRARQCGDIPVSNYVKKSLVRAFRSPDLNKINDLLKSFDQTYYRTFVDRIENSEYHAAWDNIMRNRHGVVHGGSTLTMTLTELIPTYRKSRHVMVELKAALCL